jgi:divalent metal cation (Fe/Co/Zn/Cd) transporter
LLHDKKLKNIIQVFLKSTHVETKNTFILDFTGTAAAVMGLLSLILYQLTGIQHFDGLGGMLIGILIAFSSVVLIQGVKNYLIGKSAGPQIEKQIKQATLQVKQVTEIIDLDTMYLGSERLLIHLDIRVQNARSLKEVETIVENVKEQVRKEVPITYSIQIETKAS